MRRAAVANKSAASKALKVVRELDAFPKVPDNYKETTASGGGSQYTNIFYCCVMFFGLFSSNYFLTYKTPFFWFSVSLVTFVIIGVLVVTEVIYYTNTQIKFDYEVDTEVEG